MISETGKNLVFLLSTPRAGSTLLGAMLGSHSAINCPPEPWFLLRLSSVYALSSQEGWFDDEVATAATRDFLSPDVFIAAARRFAATAYNVHLQRSGRRIFVDKTPRYYHILEFLAGAFPDARMIWLQRNPLAVAASFKSTWNIGVDVLTGQQLAPPSLDLTLGLRCLAHHFETPSPRRLTLQYERLVDDPETELHRVCEFLEVRYEDGMRNYGANGPLMETYRASRLGDRWVLAHPTAHREALDTWKTVLSAEEVAAVVAAVGPEMFTRLGYADVIPAGALMADPTVTRAANDGHAVTLLTGHRSPAEPLPTSAPAPPPNVLRYLVDYAVARAEREVVRWQEAHDEAAKSRDAYRTAYETILGERDRLQSGQHESVESLQAYRSAYENVLSDRDRLQAAQHNGEVSREAYRQAYETILAERDQLQAAQCEAESSRNATQRAYDHLLADRDRWRAAHEAVRQQLSLPLVRVGMALSRWLGRLGFVRPS